MLPNPTNTILPANFTCTIFGLTLKLTPDGRTPPAYLAARKISAVAPMRWVGALVAGQRFDAVDPARQGRVVALHGQKARTEFGGRGSVQGAAQDLYPRKDDHVGGGIVGADDPLLLAQPSLD